MMEAYASSVLPEMWWRDLAQRQVGKFELWLP
jgi:hypothetical protein